MSAGAVMVVGGRGMLAYELIPALEKAGWSVVVADLPECDITKTESVAKAIDAQPLSWVINCAAWTKVDLAEKEVDACFAVNTHGAGNVARECARRGLPLIHISTDYVFDGQKNAPYDETDATGPMGVYARSKHDGELQVLAARGPAWVVRTGELYGEGGPNFFNAILKRARTGQGLKVVSDQIVAPTWTRELANQLLAILRRRPPPGTYHATCAGAVSWYNAAKAALDVLGIDVPCEPVTTAEYNSPTPRALYTVLGHGALERQGLYVMRDWRTALTDWLKTRPIMTSPIREKRRCRVCDHENLEQFLDLDLQPPANALLRADDLKLPEARYPLALSHCPKCELIQTSHVVSPEVLFRNYVYFSSVSQAMEKHFAAYAHDVAERFVPKDGLVVELGSNDGILLKSLLDKPVRVLGVDPARNVAEVARAKGVPTIADFFTEGLAAEIKKTQGPANAIIANNVIAHIDDLDEVMRGINALLADDGVFVMEAPYVVAFLEHLEFDTVYHEHLSYFGVRPLDVLMNRFGLEVFDVQDQVVHGGSVRVFVRRKRPGTTAINASVEAHKALETKAGTADKKRLDEFARKVAAVRDDIRGLVAKLKSEGKRVVGYTAPAKGNVLLNYCQLNHQDLAYLADATPAKQGLYSPGMHIPVLSPEHFRNDSPDYALLLAWNHKDEILKKEDAWRKAGGKFIIPVPKVEIV